MKANRAYRLIVRRGGLAPALLAAPDRLDHIEVDTGEVALFWDLDPRRATRLARALKADLAQLDSDAFMAAWRAGDGPSGSP